MDRICVKKAGPCVCVKSLARKSPMGKERQTLLKSLPSHHHHHHHRHRHHRRRRRHCHCWSRQLITALHGNGCCPANDYNVT